MPFPAPPSSELWQCHSFSIDKATIQLGAFASFAQGGKRPKKKPFPAGSHAQHSRSNPTISQPPLLRRSVVRMSEDLKGLQLYAYYTVLKAFLAGPVDEWVRGVLTLAAWAWAALLAQPHLLQLPSLGLARCLQDKEEIMSRLKVLWNIEEGKHVVRPWLQADGFAPGSSHRLHIQRLERRSHAPPASLPWLPGPIGAGDPAAAAQRRGAQGDSGGAAGGAAGAGQVVQGGAAVAALAGAGAVGAEVRRQGCGGACG